MSHAITADPFAPGRLGPLELRNRFIKAATYEGMSPGGMPSPALVELHRRIAAGGVAMTTVAYAAVDRDGRTFPEQLWLREEAVPGLRALTRAVHDAGAKAAIQLGHCGGFSKLRPREGGWPRGPSAGFNAYGAASGLPVMRAMRVDEIEALPGQFARAAAMAEEAGFDAVEVHLGHGYLLSQFLSPASNRRTDAWGGALAGRMRLPLAVVAAVRGHVGGRLAVTAKINVEDGFSGGMPQSEVLELAQALDAAGIDGVTTSGGSVSRNALFLLRGARPLQAMVKVEKSRLQRVALRVLGPAVLRTWPFEETFFREPGRRVLARVRCPVILLGGVVSRANAITAMQDGFAFVQLGRALLADPELVQRFERGEVERTRCTACNQCIAAMDDGGVRCVLDDPGGELVRRAGEHA